MAVGAAESMLAFALLGAPAILTLVFAVKMQYERFWAAGAVWAVCLALLVWSLDLQPVHVDPPFQLLGNGYIWILGLLVVTIAVIGGMLGGEYGAIGAGIGSTVLGALCFFYFFPMASGWSSAITLGDRWKPLVDLLGILWIGGTILMILLVARLGKRGSVIGTSVLLFIAQITYLGVLTWYQVTYDVLVRYSIGWMLAIYTVLFAFVTAAIPQFRNDIYGAGASLFLAVLIVYFAYTVFLPCIITSTTGYPIVLDGTWMF